MSPLVKRDSNEQKLTALLLLDRGSPNYYQQLFRRAKDFFYGMQREDLVEKLDYIIQKKIEEVMGVPISNILLVYKNMPALNSFTRSRNPTFKNVNVYKQTIQTWLDEIENWIFMQVWSLEHSIRYTLPAKTYI